MNVCLTFLVVLVAVAFYFRPQQPKLPEHLLHHEAIFVPDMLSEKQAAGLRDVLKSELILNTICLSRAHTKFQKSNSSFREYCERFEFL